MSSAGSDECSVCQQVDNCPRCKISEAQDSPIMMPGSSKIGEPASSPESVDEEESESLKKFKERYRLLDILGCGSFGEVHNGYDAQMDRFVAIKIEKVRPGKGLGTLEKEYDRYEVLSSRLTPDRLVTLHPFATHGVPQIYGFYGSNKRSLLVMEKLGPSLETLFNKCKRKFSLKTVKQIAVQMIDRIETVHAARMLHRDIKPDNFVIGCAEDMSVGRNFIRIIDFGLSKDYVHPNGRHVEMSSGKELVGTVRYVSLRVHDGFEQSRRDDIEAIGHVLIYFIKRGLPWMGINPPDNLDERQKTKARYKLIGDKKRELGVEGLCRGLPNEFKRYMEYARNVLSFEEKPDYEFLRSLFMGSRFDGTHKHEHYDWDDVLEHDEDDAEDKSSTNKPAAGTPYSRI